MKVVITTDCFLPRWDGIARFLSELLPSLAQSMQITVFAPKFPGKLPIIRGVKVIRFPLGTMQFGDIVFSKPDREAMEKVIRDADVLFNQTIGPVGVAGIRIAKKYKKPIVGYAHSIEWELASRALRHGRWFIRNATRLFARSMLNKYSLLFVPSKEVEDLLVDNKIKTKMEVVHLGVNVNQFTPPKSKAAAKKKIGISPSKRVIGFCGRIAREKDLPTLHEAFKKVQQKVHNTVLLIVGEGLEQEIPASRSVLRVGRQDDVVPYLQAMDIFVLPSLTETSSLATMEAMAVGLAVVVTPVGNIREYVVDGKNGFIFPRQKVNALAEKLEFLLKHAKLRAQLGRQARQTIAKEYSWHTTIEKIKKALTTFSG